RSTRLEWRRPSILVILISVEGKRFNERSVTLPSILASILSKITALTAPLAREEECHDVFLPAPSALGNSNGSVEQVILGK
ncbi:Odorant receptor 43a, partial [Frankliniella fusca]